MDRLERVEYILEKLVEAQERTNDQLVTLIGIVKDLTKTVENAVKDSEIRSKEWKVRQEYIETNMLMLMKSMDMLIKLMTAERTNGHKTN